MKLVPDTSAIIDGRASTYLSDSPDTHTIIIPNAVVSELERQANNNEQTGWDGLEELQELTHLAETTDLTLDYTGDRPSPSEAANAAHGDIDARIRELARNNDATLLTSDVVQAEVAEATDTPVEYVEPNTAKNTDALAIEEFFDDETMSVHLKTNARPKAKRGTLDTLQYEHIAAEPSSREQMSEWAHEIKTRAHNNPDAFTELDRNGMTIIQYDDYRIAVAEQPFADTTEITAVRPLVKTTLDDYTHTDELTERLDDQKRGVLISGAPGAGKSTFAQAVAEYLNDNDHAVKTMENPRDLQVSDDITQYTELDGDMANTADSLLLVRPDYTIYDEVRKTDDFETFADMRLAGVGMIGVVHATRGIDALQRLVGRVELGMIPQIVDTVVYIETGGVETLYDVTTEVKVPAGMESDDLARPVINVVNMDTGEPEYEIYTFNRQVVTVPLDDVEDDEGGTGVSNLATGEIKREFQEKVAGPVTVEVTGDNTATVYIPERDIPQVIGEGGTRIAAIEDHLGMGIDVQPQHKTPTTNVAASESVPDRVPVTPTVGSNHISFTANEHAGEVIEVHADNEYLFTATVGKHGSVNVKNGSAIAEELERAIENHRQITYTPDAS